MQALSIIREEHASIASMLQGLSALVHGIRDYRMPPNFELLRAMLYYVESFPERLHHPKEERWLFRLLAERHPPARPLVDLLCEQHKTGAVLIATVRDVLHRYERHGSAHFAAFAAAVDQFIAFERDHMGREEREALPLAEKYLTPDDWEDIDEAFAAHADPLRGVPAQDGFAELHRRLTRLRDGPAQERAGEP